VCKRRYQLSRNFGDPLLALLLRARQAPCLSEAASAVSASKRNARFTVAASWNTLNKVWVDEDQVAAGAFRRQKCECRFPV
jgi:hypothetical protein